MITKSLELSSLFEISPKYSLLICTDPNYEPDTSSDESDTDSDGAMEHDDNSKVVVYTLCLVELFSKV